MSLMTKLKLLQINVAANWGSHGRIAEEIGLEAMAQVANGKSTKIIIPSNLQGLAGLATSAGELFSATGAPQE